MPSDTYGRKFQNVTGRLDKKKKKEEQHNENLLKLKTTKNE